MEFGNGTGDWYTTCILTNIARFASRGVDMYRRACFIAKSKGDKIFNNNDFFKKTDNINKLIDLNVPFEEAEVLVNEKLYDVKIGDGLKFDLINIDEGLYEGISNTSKYTIIARIGSYYVTFMFNNDSYTRYINHIIDHHAQIASNEKSIIKIIEAPITGVEKRNTVQSKAKIYNKTKEAKEQVNIGLILKAYKEISEFAQEIETNYINSKVIDCVVDLNKKRLTKKV